MSEIKNREQNPKHKNKSVIRKLYEIFTPRERVQAFMLFLLSLLTAFTQVVGVVSIFPFINVVMNPQTIQENRWLRAIYQRGAFSDADSFVLFLGSAVFVGIVISSIAPALTSWGQTRFVLNKEYALSKRLLTVYLSRPYQYFLGKNTSELGKNVLSEVGQLTGGFLTAIFDLLIQGVLLIALIGVLLIVNVRVTLGVMMLLGGTYVFLSFMIKQKIKKSGTGRLKANEGRFRFANEALCGIKTTQVMGIESYFLENFSHNALYYAKYQIFASLAGTLPRYFLEAVAFGGIVFFLVFKMVLGSTIGYLIPLVSLYAFAAYRMMPALHKLYGAANNIFYFQAVLDKIYTDMIEELLKDESGNYIKTDGIVDEAELQPKPLSFENSILLDHISFQYSDSRENVINGLTIKIEKNSVIGFVGATGSGKTTVVDIILGLLVSKQGRILIDDKPITKNNVREWQKKIGYVPQDIYLSDDTIRKNIAFGVKEDRIDDQQVTLAARIAAIDRFIERQLSEQYDTFIGERGVRLSGGQRQRIGLARALYRNPEILVLDEATSSLDGSTEEAVLKAIKQAAKARTVIMIAHRLNTLKDCDQIFILSEGKIIGNGIYKELLENNEEFMKMAKVDLTK